MEIGTTNPGFPESGTPELLGGEPGTLCVSAARATSLRARARPARFRLS
jgi:hypothetical protein